MKEFLDNVVGFRLVQRTINVLEKNILLSADRLECIWLGNVSNLFQLVGINCTIFLKNYSIFPLCDNGYLNFKKVISAIIVGMILCKASLYFVYKCTNCVGEFMFF